MVLRVLIFLVLNFAALGLGGYFTGQGVTSEWFAQLNQAPWNPPGWVFGFAWTSIMILFTFYLSFLWKKVKSKDVLVGLYIVQWILNVGWNPLFFYHHYTGIALIEIITLTILIAFFFFHYWKHLQYQSLFLLPYLVWMCIATSLNWYIYINN